MIIGILIGSALLVTEPAPAAAPTFNYTVFKAFEDTITSVSARVIPLVVHIEAVQKLNNRKQKVGGSGFIVSADGYIITNEHVVTKAQKVEVTLLKDKRKYQAKIIGADEQTDIAVLKIEPTVPLRLPTLGDYERVRVGEGVLAIGNPYGLDGTVSFGIVSAKGRDLAMGSLINNFIQTDAMIDHGSSGGPLVNLRGEIIGVNSMAQGRGIGFTIPINTALEVFERMRKNGGVFRRGWLGVTVQPLNRDLAEYMGSPEMTGAIVTQVVADSPAARAGVQVEDVIVRIGEETIDVEDDKDVNNFRRVVANSLPGAETPVKVWRGKSFKILTVALGEQPKIEGDEVETNFGFTVEEITASMRLANRLVDKEGVFVSFVEKDSVAAEAGIAFGEVVLNLAGTPVRTLADFKKTIDALKPGSRFLIKARQGDALRHHLLIPYGKNIKGEIQKN